MEHEALADFLVIALVIYATSLHELAHAYVATWCGDPTPGLHGRLTWNPIPHLSPVITAIVFPILMYVSSHRLFILALTPVNPARFKHPLRDDALVSAAGPAMNFLITAILLAVMRIPGVLVVDNSYHVANWTSGVLPWAAYWIYIMGFFNLMPVPPLDGYGIFRAALPLDLRRQADDFARSPMALIVAMLLGGFLFQYVEAPLDHLFWEVLMPGASRV